MKNINLDIMLVYMHIAVVQYLYTTIQYEYCTSVLARMYQELVYTTVIEIAQLLSLTCTVLPTTSFHS